MIPGDRSFYLENRERYEFTWNISKINVTEIEFMFEFADYAVISSIARDNMRVKILKPEAFVSVTSRKATEFDSALMVLPRQVKNVEVQ